MSTEEWLRAGLSHHRASRYAEAEAFYRRVLQVRPEHPDALHLLGLAVKEAGHAEDAIDLLRRAIALRPTNANYCFSFEVTLADFGDTAGAIGAYRDLLAAAPDHYLGHNNLGVELGREGELEAAREAFQHALRIQPDFAEAHVNLADLIHRIGRSELRAAGEAAARRAIELAPGLGRAHLALAKQLAFGRNFAAAIEAARQAVAIDPSAPGYVELAGLLLKGGELQQAADTARHALTVAPGNPDLHCLIGTVLLKQGEAEAAIEQLRESLILDPDNRAAFNALAVANLGIALSAVGRTGAAAELIDLRHLVVPTRLKTPNGYDDLAGFNRSLAAKLLTHPTLKWEPAGYVTRGGALTDDLLARPSPTVAALEAVIRDAVAKYLAGLTEDSTHPFRRILARSYRMVIWGVVLEGQGYLKPHIHENSWISGAYYVQLPTFGAGSGEANAGAIEFGQPANAFGYDFAPELRVIEPQEGLIVLFPSSLFHRTVAFESDRQRISISFNCYGV